MGSRENELDVGHQVELGHFESARSTLLAIDPEASLLDAETMMRLHDFSQVAVVSGQRSPKGAVSWRSIALAKVTGSTATVEAATEHARVEPLTCPLRDVLPWIIENDYVFTKASNGVVVGIVTVADVAGKYAELTDPFLYCGQIDRQLRLALSSSVKLADLQLNGGGRRVRTFDDLAFGDYQRAFDDAYIWDMVGWHLSRSEFCRVLESVREIRNRVMHFDPEPLSPKDTALLKSFAKALTTLASPTQG
jgi:CBS domain-containing protein